MNKDQLLADIRQQIGLKGNLSHYGKYTVIHTEEKSGYVQQLISYENEGNTIPAYLLLPQRLENCPAILIHHQHNSQRHLGKSEVCGLAGDPLQAFGPPLARKGFVVLCPDSICFEDRRPNAKGIEPDEYGDFLQHYNEMCYRLVKGDTLLRTVLSDAMAGVSVLESMPFVMKGQIGTLGHSYGGNTVLFLMALDKRISYGCASGSACTYKDRIQNGVGIEMASVVPGILNICDIDDLVACIAPTRLLIVSADDDKYSLDASFTYRKAQTAYIQLCVPENLQHKQYPGGHAITQERFTYIIEWLCGYIG